MAVQQWCTVRDIKDQLGDPLGDSIYDQFTDDISQPDEFVEGLIEAATGTARSYIWARYEEVAEGWTAVNVPKSIRYGVRDIAVYLLATHRINPRAPSATIDVWRMRYEDAMKWFREIASGDAALDVEVVPGQRGGTRGRIIGKDRSPVF